MGGRSQENSGRERAASGRMSGLAGRGLRDFLGVRKIFSVLLEMWCQGVNAPLLAFHTSKSNHHRQRYIHERSHPCL